jgi:hypothetical protein
MGNIGLMFAAKTVDFCLKYGVTRFIYAENDFSGKRKSMFFGGAHHPRFSNGRTAAGDSRSGTAGGCPRLRKNLSHKTSNGMENLI